jgi:hypothetical protein
MTAREDRTMKDDDYRLYHDVKAAEVVLGREVAVRRPRKQPIDHENGGRVAAIERGVRAPDGTTVYERVEYSD